MSLAGSTERLLYLEGEVVRLGQELRLAEEGLANSAQEVKQLRDAIEAHQLAVCDNPKAAGQDADERLWSVLHPSDNGA